MSLQRLSVLPRQARLLKASHLSPCTIAAFHTFPCQKKSVIDQTKDLGHSASVKASKGVDKILEKASGLKESIVHSNATEKVKKVVDDINHKTGQGLSKGIDAAEEAAQKAKEKLAHDESMAKDASELAQKKAKEYADDVSKSAQDAAQRAKGTVQDEVEKASHKAKEAIDNAKKKI